MVRDAIVFRCKHPKVRKKCLHQAGALTFGKAIEIDRNYETDLSSLKKLASDEDLTVNTLNQEKRPPSNRYTIYSLSATAANSLKSQSWSLYEVEL